jgi:hypothetical protein
MKSVDHHEGHEVHEDTIMSNSHFFLRELRVLRGLNSFWFSAFGGTRIRFTRPRQDNRF